MFGENSRRFGLNFQSQSRQIYANSSLG